RTRRPQAGPPDAASPLARPGAGPGARRNGPRSRSGPPPGPRPLRGSARRNAAPPPRAAPRPAGRLLLRWRPADRSSDRLQPDVESDEGRVRVGPAAVAHLVG